MPAHRLGNNDDTKCKNCLHSRRIHRIMVYEDKDGYHTREVTDKPLHHLTEWGYCSCVEFVEP